MVRGGTSSSGSSSPYFAQSRVEESFFHPFFLAFLSFRSFHPWHPPRGGSDDGTRERRPEAESLLTHKYRPDPAPHHDHRLRHDCVS